jgi:integrase
MFDVWLERHVQLVLAKRTFETYEGIVRLHLRPRFGDLTLDELESDVVALYFIELIEQNLPTTTISRIKTTLQSCLRWALAPNKWLPAGLMASIVTPTPRPGIRANDHRDARAEPVWIPNADDVDVFARANSVDPLLPMWAAAFTLGLRPSELVALGTDSLAVLGPAGPTEVHIHRKIFRSRQRDATGDRPFVSEEPKRASYRELLAPRSTIRALLRQAARMAELRQAHPEWPKEWDGLLFRRSDGFPYDPVELGYLFGRACKRAGGVWIDQEGKSREPYCARHYCASQLLQQGLSVKDVSAWLGHKTTVMVERTYAHVIRRMRSQITAGEALEEVLPPALFGSDLGSGQHGIGQTAVSDG